MGSGEKWKKSRVEDGMGFELTRLVVRGPNACLASVKRRYFQEGYLATTQSGFMDLGSFYGRREDRKNTTHRTEQEAKRAALRACGRNLREGRER